MWVDSLTIVNMRSFGETTFLSLARGLNVLVGANNAGKSTILRCLYALQSEGAVSQKDIRVGQLGCSFSMHAAAMDDDNPFNIDPAKYDNRIPPEIAFTMSLQHRGLTAMGGLGNPDQLTVNYDPKKVVPRPKPTEPHNFVYYFSSKRKVGSYNENVNIHAQRSVRVDLADLPAKVDRLCSPGHPRHREFLSACREIIGFEIHTYAVEKGKRAGLSIDGSEHIDLEQMGEGVPHLLGFICALCVAKNRLFLLEEIENDIHPKALKALLRLIASNANANQFVISTHSNIVMKYLCAENDSQLFEVTMSLQEGIPTSKVAPVANETYERRAILESLGYELSDLGHWAAWLVLEESSAEELIRSFLIPWFANTMDGRLRTIAGKGIDSVEPKFEDFDRLFLFTNLEPVYKNRAWVIVDGDEPGQKVVSRLRQTYEKKGWNVGHFIALTETDFENYYPSRFKEKAMVALATHGKDQKRDAKRNLLDEVKAWAKENPDTAREEFEISAAEVIGHLRAIEAEFVSSRSRDDVTKG